MFKKLLSIASIYGTITGISLTRKLIGGFIIILTLTTVGAIIAGALVVFGLYESYQLLLRHGLDADMATLVTSLFALMILLLIVALIAYKAKQLRSSRFTLSQLDDVRASLVGALRGFYRGISEKSAS